MMKEKKIHEEESLESFRLGILEQKTEMLWANLSLLFVLVRLIEENMDWAF